MKSITDFLNLFTPAFTRPAFKYFERLVKGFLETHNPRALTVLNQHKPSEEHFSQIYDFLKNYAWTSLDLAHILFQWLQNHLQPNERVILVLDDTKKFKPHARSMEGLCWHAEHHRLVRTRVTSPQGEELTATGVVGQKGHNWVVVGLLHRLAAGHWCCFPLRADLFIRQKYCPETFRDKLEIAQELIQELKPPAQTLMVGDNFYAAARLVNALDTHVLSHLKQTAVAYHPALKKHTRGRPKVYGEKIPLRYFLDQPEQLKRYTLMAYGQEHQIEIASIEALLKGHTRLMKIALVKGLRKEAFLLFTTDLNLSPEQMVEYYAARFQIEITFRELKQDLGAFNYRVRSQVSFGRYFQIACVAYAWLKYLAIQGEVKPLSTAWYKPKGLASPARVQQVLSQSFQAQRIFEGVLKAGVIPKNTSPQDFMHFANV